MVDTHCDEKLDPRDWDLEAIGTDMLGYFDIQVAKLGNLTELGIEDLRDRLQESVTGKYEEKEQRLGQVMRVFERDIMLRVVDHAWKEHLLALDHLGGSTSAVTASATQAGVQEGVVRALQTMKERVGDPSCAPCSASSR